MQGDPQIFGSLQQKYYLDFVTLIVDTVGELSLSVREGEVPSEPIVALEVQRELRPPDSQPLIWK